MERTSKAGARQLAIAAALLAASPAVALQPLQTFVAAAREHNPDALEAGANLAQQAARAESALGKQLPGISLRGTYGRNQYETLVALPGLPTTTIVPKDQWDGSATLSVPLVDLAAFGRIGAARTGAEGAARQLDSARLQVEAQAVQDYYQLVADMALLGAARAALDVSRESLRFAQARLRAGAATELEVDRAKADLEQQVQQVASAQLQINLAARALQSATGLTPDLSSLLRLDDDLHSEPELPAFEADLKGVPAVAAAAAGTRAAQQEADAQRLALLPSLAGSVAERATNAPGFVGHDWTWQAGVTLSWSFDLTNLSNIRGQQASADAARARELKATLAARDAIHRHWSTIEADIARSRSARSGREAAAHAAALALKSYQAGSLTQLDLLQALRDSFTAEVARIQADADLVNARAQLRLAAGRSLVSN